LGDINLTNVLVDLFLAGSETTSTTLNWAFLHMILNPNIQEKVRFFLSKRKFKATNIKVHQELDEVFGKGVTPSSSLRGKTPYTEAVLHEVQRLGNILTLRYPMQYIL